jgi:hypothetical protein
MQLSRIVREKKNYRDLSWSISVMLHDYIYKVYANANLVQNNQALEAKDNYLLPA